MFYVDTDSAVRYITNPLDLQEVYDGKIYDCH